jgi:hypothetical protein
VTDLRTDLDNLNLVIDFAVLDDELDRSPRLWCAALVGAAGWFTSYPNEAKYVWRGHASAAWALQPRLHRHVARHLGSSSRDRVDQERRRILADAEHNGWNYVQGRRIVGMELLARLQHHGVPTSLLDVTRDPLVGMFFAVAQAKDEAGSNADGALIAIRDPEVTVSETGTEKPRRRFSPSSAWYGVWPAPPIDPRITSQRGEFIVLNESKAHSGSASSHPLNPRNSIGIGIESPRGSYTGGSLDAYFKGYREPKGRGRPPGNPVNVAMLIIPARMKSHLKTFLDASGINDRSVYPDMAGYANSFPPA